MCVSSKTTSSWSFLEVYPTVCSTWEGRPSSWSWGGNFQCWWHLIFLEYNAYCHVCTWETFLPGPGSFSTWDFPVHYQWENLNRKHKTERFKAPKAKEKTTNIYQAKRLFKTFDDLSPKALVMPWRQPQSLEWKALPFPCCSFAQCPRWVWTVVHLNCSSAPHLTHIQQQQWEATRRYIFLKQTSFRLFVLKGWESLFFAVLIQRRSLQHIFLLSSLITQISTHFPAYFSILLSSTGSPVSKILF